MPHVTRLRVVSAAVAAGALTLGSLATATAAQAGTTRRAIADTHPAWAVAAKRLSSRASGTVDAKVYLAPSNSAQLAADVAAVSDPRSSQYRHFLTAAEVTREFAPSAAEISSVKSWLTSSGLSVTQVSAAHPAGAYIAVRGSLAAASKAFGVSFGTYRAPGGQVARAPESAATAPAPVASSVLAVAWTPRRARSSPTCRRRGRTTGWPARARPTTARRSPPASPRRTARTSPGTCAATRRSRSGAPTASPRRGCPARGRRWPLWTLTRPRPCTRTPTSSPRSPAMPKFATGQYQQYQVQPYTLAGAERV